MNSDGIHAIEVDRAKVLDVDMTTVRMMW